MQVLLDLCSIVSDLARSKNILLKKKTKQIKQSEHTILDKRL